jgi:hypothetical protein
MKNLTSANWSFRPVLSTYGISYSVYPKGERSHWAVKATLYPASDGKTYVVSMSGLPLDARPSLGEAIDLVLRRLN